MSDTSKREDRDLLAAEYVLGVLSAAERREAERRLAADLAFQRDVAFWEEKLGGLATPIAPVTAPADGWARVEAAIARADKERRSGFWNNIALWRTFALGSASVALASLLALAAVVLQPTPGGEQLLARLDAEGGKLSFVAAVNPGGDSLTIVPASLLVPEQKSMELWLIPKGEKPHSLGLIDPNRPLKVEVPKELLDRVNQDATLAVSLEPEGGSPTGQPTGPVIANGKLAQL